MPQLEINPEIVCEIIARAREFHAQEGVSFPHNVEEYSEDDLMQVLANHKNDLTYLELKRNIDGLEEDQQITLVALMYIGRGDFEVDEWDTCLEEA